MNKIVSRAIVSVLKNIIGLGLLVLTAAYLVVVYIALPLSIFVGSFGIIKAIFGISNFPVLAISAFILSGISIWYVQEKIPAAYEAIRELPLCMLSLAIVHAELMDSINFRTRYELPPDISPYSLRDSLIKRWSLEMQVDKERESMNHNSDPSVRGTVITQSAVEESRPSVNDNPRRDFDEFQQ